VEAEPGTPEGEVLCDALDDAIDRLNGMDHPSRAAVDERARRAQEALREVRRINGALHDLASQLSGMTGLQAVRELLGRATEATKRRCPKWSEVEAALRAAEEVELGISRRIAAAEERKKAVRAEGIEAWRLRALLDRSTFWENFQLSKAFADGFKACQGQMVMAPNAGRARLSAEVFLDVLRDRLLQGQSWADARTGAIEQQVAAIAKQEKEAGRDLGNARQVIAEALRKLADCMEKEYRRSLRAWIAGDEALAGLTPAQMDVVMRISFEGATAEERRVLEQEGTGRAARRRGR
jgi:hypothetical protein